MKITVTADDICNGVRENTHKCPIARAVSRVFNVPTDDVEVGDDENNNLKVKGDTYDLPEEAVEFFKAFDSSEPVNPFEFEIDDEPLERGSDDPDSEPEGD